MNALTTKEMETLLGTLNVLRRKAKREEVVLLEVQEFLAALHVSGYAIVKQGTIKQFEAWWRIADNTIKRYRDMGLLDNGVKTSTASSSK
jgi:hypothetical protein